MYGLDPTTPVEATATPVDEYEFEEGGSIDMVVFIDGGEWSKGHRDGFVWIGFRSRTVKDWKVIRLST
jgi:hypothetical protein